MAKIVGELCVVLDILVGKMECRLEIYRENGVEFSYYGKIFALTMFDLQPKGSGIEDGYVSSEKIYCEYRGLVDEASLKGESVEEIRQKCLDYLNSY